MCADVDALIVSVTGADAVGGFAIADVAQRFEREATEKQHRAEQKVCDFCAREGVPFNAIPGVDRVSAEWFVETGDDERWPERYDRTADLIVLGRAHSGGPAAMALLEAAPIRTGRPMLIAAATPLQLEGGTVAIAWKDTREAARAVGAAVSFVTKASRVIILSVEEDATGRERSCSRLSQALRWHNSEVMLQGLVPSGRAPVETMLDAVASVRASLLVTGGYSHSRARELMFGGFTRRVLGGAKLPVLMAR